MRSRFQGGHSANENAITSQAFDPSELTVVSALEAGFGASHKPVYG